MFRQTVFRLFSLCFGLAALYHLVGFMFPDLVAPAPAWRHALFVGINTCGCWLLIARPTWLIWPFTLLTLQQIYSHTNRAVDWWINQSKVDWLSLGVIVVLPLAWRFLWQERQEQKHLDGSSLTLRQAQGDRSDIFE